VQRTGTPTGRLVGVDATRGLAVLGMAVAHVGDAGDWGEPTGWLQVADGRSAATFATLAGVSAGLLSGGRTPRDLPGARIRIATRALLIGTLGVLLVALGTPVVVILPTYAVMFLALIPVLGAGPRALAWSAAVVLAAGSVVLAVVDRDVGWPASILVGHYYPAVVWFAYLLAGLAVVRAGLLTRPGPLAAIGSGLGVLGYGVGAVAATRGQTVGTWLDLTPHTSTAPEVLGNLGVALTVLAATTWLAGRVPWLLAPVAATGALALTAYTGQVVAIAVLGPDAVFEPSNLVLVVFLLVTVAACWAWRALLGRGPLERLVHAASTGAAEALRDPA
jgi:uncharacterized membrane protein YeiB